MYIFVSLFLSLYFSHICTLRKENFNSDGQ